MQSQAFNSCSVQITHYKDIKHPFGMVVFFKEYKFTDGYIEGVEPSASKLAVAHSYVDETYANETEFFNLCKTYKVAGVTYVDSIPISGDKDKTRGTVYVNGAVPFCNTGYDAIDAGDEVWAVIGENKTELPRTVGRQSNTLAALTAANYRYVGRCIMGCEASDIKAGVIRYGQILLGVE